MIFPTSSSWLSGSSVSSNFQLQALCGEFFASKRHWSHWNSIKLRKSWNWRASSVSKITCGFDVSLLERCKLYANVLRLLDLLGRPMRNYDGRRSNAGAPNKIVMAFFVIKKAEINITMQQGHDLCLRITAHRIHNMITYHMCIYIYIYHIHTIMQMSIFHPHQE